MQQFRTGSKNVSQRATSRSYQKASALCNVFVIESTIHNRNKASVRKSKVVVPSKVAAVVRVLSTFTGAPFTHTLDTTKAIVSLRIQISHSSASSFIRRGEWLTQSIQKNSSKTTKHLSDNYLYQIK
jgi:molybdenum cofactor biosynthesis enzyme